VSQPAPRFASVEKVHMKLTALFNHLDQKVIRLGARIRHKTGKLTGNESVALLCEVCRRRLSSNFVMNNCAKYILM
jgi:hypothetical protein